MGTAVIRILIALAIGYGLWRVSIAMIRMLASPPPEIDPEDIVETHQEYWCTVCGTGVTMTIANATAEQKAPRHCREPMVLAPPG
jgi:hypothetical protein